jgi:hypothetical protein
MPKENKSDATQDAPKNTKDAGERELQETFDKANEQGFFGEEQDKTPNENYTLQGVTSGAKTPETDPEIAAQQPGSKK